jgi:hypothetical protein
MRGLAIVIALLLAGCGSPPMTARDAVDEFTAAGLSAPNPQDVTDTACAEIGCEEAVATEVVTVFRWEDSSQAMAHSDDLKQPAYSLNEFVIAFPPDTDVDTSEYAAALEQAAVRRSD